jgi:hypothetical protein
LITEEHAKRAVEAKVEVKAEKKDENQPTDLIAPETKLGSV